MRLRLLALALALHACGDDAAVPAPTAYAGLDQRVRIGATVTLDGSASRDPGGRALSYAWQLIERPGNSAAELSGEDSAAPTFVADRAGAYLLVLRVSNGEESSPPDPVVIEARNQRPVPAPQCAAGSDCRVLHGRQATLDGSASYDPDGDPITFAWRQCNGACSPCTTPPAPVSLVDTETASASFTAPHTKNQTLVFELTASDADGSASACVSYLTANTSPVALLAAAVGSTNPTSVAESATFTLSGAPSGDPDGDALTYAWTQATSTHPAIITSAGSASTTVQAPLIAEPASSVPSVSLTFTLTVSDGVDSASVPLTVVVNN